MDKSFPFHIRIAEKLFGDLAYQTFLWNRGLENWFYSAITYQFKISEEGWSPFGNYYEFGVGWGRSMSAYLRAQKKFCNITKTNHSKFQIFGFDSFEGLPESKRLEDQHPNWKKNKFSYDIEGVKKEISNNGLDLNKFNIKFIKGNFLDSLTTTLMDEIKKFPPSIVTIDVDYYSSTKIVLEWMEPILKSGTLFYFDDIWSFHGNSHYGELKAIDEFNETFDGHLRSFPLLGKTGSVYIYSKKKFEY